MSILSISRELIGIEYLLNQSGHVLENIDAQVEAIQHTDCEGEVLDEDEDEDEPIDGTISNVEDVTVPSCPDPSFQHSTAPEARAGSTDDEQEVESDVIIPEVLAPTTDEEQEDAQEVESSDINVDDSPDKVSC